MSFRTLRPHLQKEDRNRPSFRRSELSSRRILMGERTNPWDRLQAPGYPEPTSRSQTRPPIRTLRTDNAVIPGVTPSANHTFLSVGRNAPVLNTIKV